MSLEIPLDVLNHLGSEVPEDILHQGAPQPPPASHFRLPDGSLGNIRNEKLGHAGCPFARIIHTEAEIHGAKPEPEKLIDGLMPQGHNFYASGVSQLTFYYTSLIAYDILYQNHQDMSINDTSSYLDLSPLYGRNQAEQNSVRAFKNGLLKPDIYADPRPSISPGVAVLLVLFNRFHNFAAQTVLAINEKGKFTPPADKPKREQDKWLDEQVFQTARAITVGLYVNIILQDYLRALTNTPIKDTEGKDPRVTLHDFFDKQGLPKGAGNQVSVELNLLYRLYFAIPRTNTSWLQESYRKIFPQKDPAGLSDLELLKALDDHAQAHPIDPSQRTFGALKRGKDGVLLEADLIEVWLEIVEQGASPFGVNVSPDVYKPLAKTAIEQARKWHAPTLNEFRKFLKLAPFKKFEEVHSDPDVATNLKNLYGDIDYVELYPGLYFEEQKEDSFGSSTAVRSMLVSSLSLVRGDRFLTHDFTAANLTAWGIKEIAPDYTILGGAKIFLLVLNGFGRYIAFNSVYAMLPFFTPTRSKEIVEKLEIAHLFSFTRPAGQSPQPVPILTHAGVTTVLGDQKNFRVPWAPHMTSLSTFMLASDKPESAKQKRDLGEAIYGQKDALKDFEAFAMKLTHGFLTKKSHPIGHGTGLRNVIDIAKDVADLVATHFVAKLVYLPLNCSTGPSYTEVELTKLLDDVFIYIFADSDPTRSWARRRDGDNPCAKLVDAMVERVKHVQDTGAADSESKSECPVSSSAGASGDEPLANYGIMLVKRLLATHRSVREVAEILSGIAVGFHANASMLFTQMVDFYLNEAKYWEDIKALAAKPGADSDAKLQGYVLEGYRLSLTLALLRYTAPGVNTEIEGRKIKGGDVIFINLMTASRDPSAFPNPTEVNLTRPIDSYVHYGYGPHKCFGKPLNMSYARGMLKVLAQLPGLERAPGDDGVLHYTTSLSGLKNYLSADWSELSPLPSSKLIS
ncbi:heme peroxidase [Terfezia claveryi]|nr:heme peroxidase [Terfezia claveryi]